MLPIYNDYFIYIICVPRQFLFTEHGPDNPKCVWFRHFFSQMNEIMQNESLWDHCASFVTRLREPSLYSIFGLYLNIAYNIRPSLLVLWAIICIQIVTKGDDIWGWAIQMIGSTIILGQCKSPSPVSNNVEKNIPSEEQEQARIASVLVPEVK